MSEDKPALSFKTLFLMVQVRFFYLCTKWLCNHAHVVSPHRPSPFSVCNIKNVGAAWGLGYLWTSLWSPIDIFFATISPPLVNRLCLLAPWLQSFSLQSFHFWVKSLTELGVSRFHGDEYTASSHRLYDEVNLVGIQTQTETWKPVL
jgi:hypothetical protein